MNEYDEFLKQTAKDYEIDLAFVKDAFDKYGLSSLFYKDLEDELDRRKEL
jgi:hypothetical protein